MHDRRGFTLIELLIAMFLSMLVISAGYSVFYGSSRAATMQTQDSRMQDNARTAMDALARGFRMVGLNVKNGNYPPGESINGVVGQKFLPVDHNNAPDSVTILGGSMGTGWKTTLAASAVQGADTIAVADASQIDPGDIIAIGLEHTAKVASVNKLSKSVQLETTNLPAALLNMDFQGPAAGMTAAEITLVRGMTFAVDESDIIPVLTVSTGGPPQPLAEGIEDMQIEYGVDADDDRLIRDGEWVHDPESASIGGITADYRKKVRLVRITIVARTDQEDPSLRGTERWVPTDKISKIGNRDPRKVTDGYRRFILTRVVKCRNLDILETL